MEFEVPKRLILRPTLSTTRSNEFCGGRGKRGALVEKARAHGTKRFYYNFLLNFFWGREDENKRREENGQT